MMPAASVTRRVLLGAAGAAALAGRASAGVTRVAVREAGLFATLFMPRDRQPLPAVVSLAGAEGGLWEAPARALAEAGFPALALATHNYPGRPQRLSRLDLSYVDGAIVWLRDHVRPAGGTVALRGWSRGAEMALTLASLSSNVNAVLTYAARCYIGREQDKVNSFDDPTAAPAFLWHGEEVKAVQLPPNMRPEPKLQSYEDWFPIPVERIKGPIMMVCGDADTGLAGTTPNRSARSVMSRLERLGWPHRLTYLHYPDAGHDIAGPPPYDGAAIGGGTVAGNAAAIAASWPLSLSFLRDTVATPSLPSSKG